MKAGNESGTLIRLLQTRAWPYKVGHVKQDNFATSKVTPIESSNGYKTRRFYMSADSATSLQTALELELISQLPTAYFFFSLPIDLIKVDCLKVMLKVTLLSPVQVGFPIIFSNVQNKTKF